MLETAQIRTLAFLFSTLLLLGMGKAFEQEAYHSAERTDIIHQAHTQSCKAALLANAQLSRQDTQRPFQNLYGGAPAIPSFSNLVPVFFLPGKVVGATVFTPNVKRCILYSCLRIGGPPVFVA